ncbi:cupin domain-containing protein [Ottowia thiooxydans]|uniref:cupin domain-containing protein n=1 Tax=Ottowia thiooxydans TaxID=219182 RepID=UPI0006874CD7|nr:cupin domain-containing protein [Ottowia thiooxydans]
MDLVHNVNDHTWRDETELPGARGFEFIKIVGDDPSYTSAFSCEYVRLGPDDHSVVHIEKWNHLLWFVEGTGELMIDGQTWQVSPGSYAKVKAGMKHSLRNLGGTDMKIIAVYDPPRTRA